MYNNYDQYNSPRVGGPPSTIPHQHRPQNHQDDYYDDTTSEIYIDSTYPGVSTNHHHDQFRSQASGPPPPPPPRVSRQPTTTRPITPISMVRSTNAMRTPSEYSSVSKSKSKTKGGVVIETMSAPNPCCPDSKGVCCILLLVNLGLLLVTLGFSVVLQLTDPPFVWWCGLLFLIVGFISLVVSLLFCMRVCRYSRWSNSSYRSSSSIGGGPPGAGGVYARERDPSELYWTHHWQKRINLPSSNRSNNHADNSDIVYHTHNRAVSSSS